MCLNRRFSRLILAMVLSLLAGSFALAASPNATPALGEAPVSITSDVVYRPNDVNALLDVYVPSSVEKATLLPTVIWTHGGAWIGGDKVDHADYYALLAAQGYAVVSLDYGLGPHFTYPLPLIEINDALTFLQSNAPRYHIDKDRLILAGDSAGAQITSQIATAITNPGYAAELGLAPSVTPNQVRGVILFCGIFDMDAFLAITQFSDQMGVWGANTVIWAYLGAKTDHEPLLAQMATIHHVSASFPATFISGGNADPLTETQSAALADKLTGLGVPVTTLFFPADYTPSLGHEYQFYLNTVDARKALAQTVAFIASVTAS
jgi:acetyl esterase/lipase